MWARSPARAERARRRSSPRRASTRARRRASRPRSPTPTSSAARRWRASRSSSAAGFAPGSHLDLIGSFTPAMREADDACFAGAAVFVDSDDARDQERRPDRADGARRRRSRRGDRHARRARARPARRPVARPRQRTVFKSVGSALEDLAAAMLVHAQRERRGGAHDGRSASDARFGLLARAARRCARAITAAYRRPEPEAVPPLRRRRRACRAAHAAAAQALARRLAQTLRERKQRGAAAKAWSRG